MGLAMDWNHWICCQCMYTVYGPGSSSGKASTASTRDLRVRIGHPFSSAVDVLLQSSRLPGMRHWHGTLATERLVHVKLSFSAGPGLPCQDSRSRDFFFPPKSRLGISQMQMVRRGNLRVTTYLEHSSDLPWLMITSLRGEVNVLSTELVSLEVSLPTTSVVDI